MGFTEGRPSACKVMAVAQTDQTCVKRVKFPPLTPCTIMRRRAPGVCRAAGSMTTCPCLATLWWQLTPGFLCGTLIILPIKIGSNGPGLYWKHCFCFDGFTASSVIQLYDVPNSLADAKAASFSEGSYALSQEWPPVGAKFKLLCQEI